MLVERTSRRRRNRNPNVAPSGSIPSPSKLNSAQPTMDASKRGNNTDGVYFPFGQSMNPLLKRNDRGAIDLDNSNDCDGDGWPPNGGSRRYTRKPFAMYDPQKQEEIKRMRERQRQQMEALEQQIAEKKRIEAEMRRRKLEEEEQFAMLKSTDTMQSGELHGAHNKIQHLAYVGISDYDAMPAGTPLARNHRRPNPYRAPPIEYNRFRSPRELHEALERKSQIPSTPQLFPRLDQSDTPAVRISRSSENGFESGGIGPSDGVKVVPPQRSITPPRSELRPPQSVANPYIEHDTVILSYLDKYNDVDEESLGKAIQDLVLHFRMQRQDRERELVLKKVEAKARLSHDRLLKELLTEHRRLIELSQSHQNDLQVDGDDSHLPWKSIAGSPSACNPSQDQPDKKKRQKQKKRFLPDIHSPQRPRSKVRERILKKHHALDEPYDSSFIYSQSKRRNNAPKSRDSKAGGGRKSARARTRRRHEDRQSSSKRKSRRQAKQLLHNDPINGRDHGRRIQLVKSTNGDRVMVPKKIKKKHKSQPSVNTNAKEQESMHKLTTKTRWIWE